MPAPVPSRPDAEMAATRYRCVERMRRDGKGRAAHGRCTAAVLGMTHQAIAGPRRVRPAPAQPPVAWQQQPPAASRARRVEPAPQLPPAETLELVLASEVVRASDP